MLLKDLLNITYNNTDVEISDISSNSRKVKKGTLFFALKGHTVNGSKFIDDAIKNGAVAIVCDENEKINLPENIPLIKSSNVTELLVLSLNKFYSDLPKNIFAVTGTNGKTSVAEFLRQILEIISKKSASIGTLGIVCSDKRIYEEIDDNFLTTPDIVSLYKNLAILKKFGIDDVALEASSIGLLQGRMDGIKICAGIFTNFTQDHLDYHQNMENYFDAKMILFSKFLKNNLAIINSDIPEYEEIFEVCKTSSCKIISYGKKSSDVKLNSIKPIAGGSEINFIIDGKNKKSTINIPGDFQVMNVLSALSAIYFYYNLDEKNLDKIIDNFPLLKSAQGRMQKVTTLKNGAEIYIDFAHSPDALKNILENARKSVTSRLLVLFGCGGDRDNKKRPMMGKIASDLADFVIVTDDNSRTENASEIRKEILQNCDAKKTIEIPDRKKAIKKSIEMLESRDVLIVAGKGHEKYQIIGKEKLPFDEEKIILEVIKNL